MATLDKLRRASFRGIEFLIDGDQELESGRKGQMHDYVGSDRRYFEDLGKRPDVFTVSGIVHGQDSIEKAQRLKRALDQKGSGILVHPFWGQFTVTTELHTSTASTRNLGVIRFSMTFSVGSEVEIFPSTNFNNSVRISSLSTQVQGLLKADFKKIWSTEGLTSLNVQSAVGKIADVIDVFGEVGRTVFPSLENLNEFSDFLRVFEQNTFKNVFSGEGISDDLFNIFDEYRVLADQPSDQYLLSTRLFEFGELETPIEANTLARQQRENNRIAMNQIMQLTALTQAYGTIPSLSFKTDVDLEETQVQLDKQYIKLAGEDSLVDSETLEGIKNLRTEVRKFFDNETNNVYRITEIETNPTPMTILAFDYYGNTDEVQNLVDLNKTLDVSRVKNKIKVFTA
jgi:prophage DNA circulation protein